MIRKLAFAGIQRRWSDYLVLFSGLSIGSAIFYMFAALATNDKFLKANINISSVTQVFAFGLILLTIITIVYVSYAQSFLLGMRYQDYGLFMIFGAKPRKISQMILLETATVQLGSTMIGLVLGMGLTKIASQWLANQIHFPLTGLSVVQLPAIFVTIALFGLLAISSVLVSQWIVRKKSLNSILKANQISNQPNQDNKLKILESMGGLILLGLGFTAMMHIEVLQLAAIPFALVTISSGTYLVIHSLFSWVINWLKQKAISYRGIRLFTLGQLRFRIENYTRVLSMVTILFALALGAIVVGVGYHRQIPIMSSYSSAYSMNITNPTRATDKIVAKMDLTKNNEYSQVSDQSHVYLNQAQLKQQPIEAVIPANADKQLAQPQYKSVSIKQLMGQTVDNRAFLMLEPLAQRNKKLVVLPERQFNQVNGTKSTLQLIRVRDLNQSVPQLKRLEAYQHSVAAKQGYEITNSYEMFVISNTLFGGLEFIGLFLGIAFLTMLASCLMFKVLSGTKMDRIRYQMLLKIGVSDKKLKRAIAYEIGVLFVIPGVAGIVYVALGLQMFKKLMVDPYDQWWWAVLGFTACYGVYYLLTVKLYQRLVIKTRNPGGDKLGV
ncbi:FtsX-like permease family protein [Paucilactobacillus kaifaensis]|uniref:FtsX-like permease family protein n=1 Tax=Paucilactobacillus kaifaensis TaxID=2559921 RepID=UPI0010F8FE04|nr:ABC transporter permease [Paucilactobacillus kaifaensis]